MLQFKVESGALKEVPCYDHTSSAKNWCAQIWQDPKCPGGWGRDFWRIAYGDFYYVVPPKLELGTPLEFGADHYSGKKVTRKRMYFVVFKSQPDLLVLKEFETPSQAIKASKTLKKELAMTEEEYIVLSELCDEYWTDFSKLIAEKLKKTPKHLQSHCLAMLQEKSSVYGSKFDEYLTDDKSSS